jgi:hypothetical protein
MSMACDLTLNMEHSFTVAVKASYADSVWTFDLDLEAAVATATAVFPIVDQGIANVKVVKFDLVYNDNDKSAGELLNSLSFSLSLSFFLSFFLSLLSFFSSPSHSHSLLVFFLRFFSLLLSLLDPLVLSVSIVINCIYSSFKKFPLCLICCAIVINNLKL